MKLQCLFLGCALTFSGFSLTAARQKSTELPPTPPREFRSAWVASVWNINWPSAKGLPASQQKAELIAILDRAVKLKLNAIVLQVRPSSDAFYASPYEPWSEYLSGKMGVPPKPIYDPLEFAVAEAHKRGLELHAWCNPFRARVSEKVQVSPDHVSKKHPEFVREYGKYLWLDPGDVRARDYVVKVMLDIVKRYDIDGIQIDDYFYPSPERDAQKKAIPFPDERTWQRYVKSGGKLNRDDWRHENINIFIERLYRGIKATKRSVKFGISPPGIWRPGNPPQIKGWDVYAELYADTKKWLNNGWCDYFSPQLYWPIEPAGQSFPVLLKWWNEQNLAHRNIWPGLNTYNVFTKWEPAEILNQIKITREQPLSGGHIHYHFKPLVTNPKGLDDELMKLYAQPALVPASPWLNSTAPETPKISVKRDKGGTHVSWKSSGREKAWQWVLQKKSGGDWKTEILPAGKNSLRFGKSSLPETIAVTAVSRCGVASAPASTAMR